MSDVSNRCECKPPRGDQFWGRWVCDHGGVWFQYVTPKVLNNRPEPDYWLSAMDMRVRGIR